jgi:UDP-2,4-diacetamido-2,4,6-trideoxy-beta-L-altropyranose hydrolase
LKKPGHLIICAEGGIQVGTGHVMRCLALAQSWKRAGGAVTFFLREGLAGIEERIRAEGISLETLPPETLPSEIRPEDHGLSAEAFVGPALRSGSTLAVLDGYSFGAREQAALSDAGIRVMMVDDYGHATDYPVQCVLNQNAYATPEMYTRTKADTRLLLGSGYALLRDEFLPWMGWKRSITDRARRILITVGGSDPDNASEQILRSFECFNRKDDHRDDPRNDHRDLEVVLVVGGGNPHWDALLAVSQRCPVPVRLVRSVQDMPALMAWADVAIAGAGVTSYELCYMGLPALLLVVAENQRLIAERLAQLGIAVNAGTPRELSGEVLVRELQALIESSERRRAMSQQARELVDGLGSERVRAALLDRELRLRLARESDCRLLFEWAQDPAARAASFHSAAIFWDEHVRWFGERLQDRDSVLYIGENAAGVPLGLVRFQIKGDEAVLSVNVAPGFRGEGWGRELIRFSTRSLVRTHSVRRIKAFVKPDNQASVRLFEASAFRRAGKERVANQDALLFSWESGIGTQHVN